MKYEPGIADGDQLCTGVTYFGHLDTKYVSYITALHPCYLQLSLLCGQIQVGVRDL